MVDDPTGNKMLLVMDYMEGGPVMTRDALEKGRCIPESLALQYFRDMCKVILTSPARTCLSYHVSSPFAAQGCCQCCLYDALQYFRDKCKVILTLPGRTCLS